MLILFPVLPEKLECIGHGQKHLGTRIQNLVKQHKGTSTPLSGKGKLTVNSMQNYYSKAIHESKRDLYAMNKTGIVLCMALYKLR